MSQDKIFYDIEGDNWFERNDGHFDLENDKPLRLIAEEDLNFSSVLEVGCSNDWRLEELKNRYGCEINGVEPSFKAIEGKEYIKRGLISDIPFDQKFDLVIVYFVFHWVDRASLYQAIKEIDRVTSKYLIIGDFYPNKPYVNGYKHLEGVKTFKTDYGKFFELNTAYQLKRSLVGYFGEEKIDNRYVCNLYKKTD